MEIIPDTGNYHASNADILLAPGFKKNPQKQIKKQKFTEEQDNFYCSFDTSNSMLSYCKAALRMVACSRRRWASTAICGCHVNAKRYVISPAT